MNEDEKKKPCDVCKCPRPMHYTVSTDDGIFCGVYCLMCDQWCFYTL